jgi:hypothetical protein
MKTLHDLTATVESLTAFPSVLETYFRSVPPLGLHWRPSSWDGIPSEKLTAVEQVWHVRDVEIEGYRVRFERTLREQNPDLPDLPGELMAQERGYAQADPELALRDARGHRQRYAYQWNVVWALSGGTVG